jgi:hypothetical protein
MRERPIKCEEGGRDKIYKNESKREVGRRKRNKKKK